MTRDGANLLQLEPVPRLLAALPDLGGFEDDGPIHVARAPGRLDVMGGIADYTGSLVCEMPLAVAAAAAVQHRDDDRVVCHSGQAQRPVEVPVSALLTENPQQVHDLVTGEDEWARYVLGCVWWLVGKHQHPVLREGVTIAIDSDVPLGGGVSSSAAIEVATMSALCAAAGFSPEPIDLAAACQAVENRVVGAPCGVMDQVTAALGHPRAMLELLCQPDERGRPAQVIGDVPVPGGYAFVGVHSGVRHEVKGDPYTDTRVAAFMARRILQSLDADADLDCLANVDADRFRQQLAAQLPASMHGQRFLDQYGETGDPVTRVVPERQYHVRSAATHHVLEAARVRQFVDLVRAADEAPETSRPALLREAGLLMRASHDSYRDHARLGHPLTDRLVEMVEALGPGQGFFGAKITGGGCGGTVAILIRDEPAVFDRLEAMRKQYERETGRATMLFHGTSPGAAAVGTRSVRAEVRS